MALLKDRQVVTDTWTHVGDDAEVPSDAPVIVTIARWRALRDSLEGRNAPIGVRLSTGDGPDAVLDDLDRLDLIAIPFDHFKDGRGYSSARLLRERHGFKGELRAVGNVLRDQIAFMERCGFDSFEYEGGTEASRALSAFHDLSVVYQTAADRRASAATLRNHPSRAFSNGTSG